MASTSFPYSHNNDDIYPYTQFLLIVGFSFLVAFIIIALFFQY